GRPGGHFAKDNARRAGRGGGARTQSAGSAAAATRAPLPSLPPLPRYVTAAGRERALSAPLPPPPRLAPPSGPGSAPSPRAGAQWAAGTRPGGRGERAGCAHARGKARPRGCACALPSPPAFPSLCVPLSPSLRRARPALPPLCARSEPPPHRRLAMADEKPKEGVKTENNDHINLKVAGQDGSVVQFKIKRHTPLSKLMKAYCERQGLSMRQIRFRFDGQPINETDTPAQVNSKARLKNHLKCAAGVGASVSYQNAFVNVCISDGTGSLVPLFRCN
uniref:Ubiquitin-like domain-containing protein n=3 Tax=Amniota TaxID=32524 RepID=A0A8C3UJP2_CATUS